MVMLYSLGLAKRVKGFTGTVKALPIETGLVGHWDDIAGTIVRPDMAAIRQCLPHYYRAAFDRAQCFWYPHEASLINAYMILRGSRGQVLNTLYATPYHFNPTTKPE